MLYSNFVEHGLFPNYTKGNSMAIKTCGRVLAHTKNNGLIIVFVLLRKPISQICWCLGLIEINQAGNFNASTGNNRYEHHTNACKPAQ